MKGIEWIVTIFMLIAVVALIAHTGNKVPNYNTELACTICNEEYID